MGSPPRVREEPASDYATKTDIRITPACAGRTLIWAPKISAT